MRTQQIQPIRFVQWPGGRIEVVDAPTLSSITSELLAQLSPTDRDPDDDDIYVLPGGIRYLIGSEVPDSGGCHYLHRLP